MKQPFQIERAEVSRKIPVGFSSFVVISVWREIFYREKLLFFDSAGNGLVRALPWYLGLALPVGECPVVFVEQLQVFAVAVFRVFFADGLPDESEVGCSAFVRGGNLVCRW